MRLLWRRLKALLCPTALLLLGLAVPVVLVEVRCQPDGTVSPYASILPPQSRRPEANTLLTWPEWQIVHAYEDYGKVIATADPHDYAFLPEAVSFWTSLCTLSKASGPQGGVPIEAKRMLYTIGVSFPLEMGMKAAYEETLGHLATLARGPDRAKLDTVTAQMAADYAAFLYQVPWYRWNFAEDADTLSANPAPGFRNWERRLAIGLEFRGKSLYAGAIGAPEVMASFTTTVSCGIRAAIAAPTLSTINAAPGRVSACAAA